MRYSTQASRIPERELRCLHASAPERTLTLPLALPSIGASPWDQFLAALLLAVLNWGLLPVEGVRAPDERDADETAQLQFRWYRDVCHSMRTYYVNLS